MKNIFASLESLSSPSSRGHSVKRRVKINASFNKAIGLQWSDPVWQKDSNDAWKIGFDWQNASAIKILLMERGNGSPKKLKCNVQISPSCLVNDCYYSDRLDSKIKPGKEFACSINAPSSRATLLVISVCITYYESLSDSSEAILQRARSKKLLKDAEKREEAASRSGK